MKRNRWLIVVLSVLLAWLFDIFFYADPPGISFLLWVMALLAGGFLLAWLYDERWSPWSWMWAGLALLCALMTSLRVEPVTRFCGYGLTLGALAFLAGTFRTGNWINYRLREVFGMFLRLIGAAFFALSRFFKSESNAESAPPASLLRRVLRQSMPVARGLLLALPVLIILAGLLSSADVIFAQQLENFLKLFDLMHLPETLYRILYVLILAYVLGGIYAHAVRFSAVEPTPDPAVPWCKPFIGWVEAVIVLGSVLLLFSAFVIVQFQYFFGGEANIHLTGFTYAEYARRGYFELLMVGFLSLALYLGLNLATRRQTEAQRKIFSGMAIFLMALLLVMLVSALMRLSLYHDAYGFTRLRTYVLISIIWLGLLFLAVIGLEIASRPYRFVQALLAAIFGFAFTLGVVNVDALIAGQNLERARAGKKLDANYFRHLSADAVPLLVDTYLSSDLPEDMRYILGRELACRTIQLDQEPPKSWLSLNVAESRARDLLLANQSRWQGFVLIQDRNGWVILEENGETFYCNPWRGWD